MTITITLDTGNAAFHDDHDDSRQATEYARIVEVERIVKQINWSKLLTNGGDTVRLYDYNGNKVGEARCLYGVSEEA